MIHEVNPETREKDSKEPYKGSRACRVQTGHTFVNNIWIREEEGVICGHPASDQISQEHSTRHRHGLVLRRWEAGLQAEVAKV